MERWEGVKCAALLRQPGSESHLRPGQVLRKHQENAPAPRYADNYAATHGRVRAEGARARKRLSSRCRGREPGRPEPRSRALNSLGAEAAARGGARAARGTPPPLRAQAVGASGPRRLSGRIVSGLSALLSCLRLLVPSPLRPRELPATPTAAGPRKRLVFPLLSPGTASSQSFVSPPAPPPPLFSPSRLLSSPPQANMAAAAAAAAAAASARVGDSGSSPPFAATAPNPPRHGHLVRHYGDHPGASREV